MPRRATPRGPEVIDVIANLSADAASDAEFEAQPDQEPTPEQRHIKELENQLAVERGRKDPEPEFEPPVDDDDTILIHFLEDGFTALGQVWYRGQELEFTAGSAAYRDTCDRHGQSWLDLRHDENAQIERFGHVMFREGPWPGKDYVDAATATFEPLKSLSGGGTVTPPSEDELAKAADIERKRRRAAPRLPGI